MGRGGCVVGCVYGGAGLGHRYDAARGGTPQAPRAPPSDCSPLLLLFPTSPAGARAAIRLNSPPSSPQPPLTPLPRSPALPCVWEGMGAVGVWEATRCVCVAPHRRRDGPAAAAPRIVCGAAPRVWRERGTRTRDAARTHAPRALTRASACAPTLSLPHRRCRARSPPPPSEPARACATPHARTRALPPSFSSRLCRARTPPAVPRARRHRRPAGGEAGSDGERGGERAHCPAAPVAGRGRLRTLRGAQVCGCGSGARCRRHRAAARAAAPCTATRRCIAVKFAPGSITHRGRSQSSSQGETEYVRFCWHVMLDFVGMLLPSIQSTLVIDQLQRVPSGIGATTCYTFS